MKNIQIKFDIESLDSKKNLVLKGSFDNNKIVFIDDENIHNVIHIKKNEINYLKYGEIDMNFSYIENTKTKGIYKYLNTEFHFDIFTKILTITNKQIHIESSLYQDGEIVNESILDIYYQDIEED